MLSGLTDSPNLSGMTVFGWRPPRPLLIRTAYLVVGVKIGALWLAQGENSPWEHALRLLVLMAVVMAVMTVVRHWAARRGRRVAHHPIGRFLLAKLTLVGLAVFAGLALEDSIANVNLWVSAGLAVMVAVVGPIVHPWLVKADAAEPDRSNQAVVVAA
jgi:hypothetical protein